MSFWPKSLLPENFYCGPLEEKTVAGSYGSTPPMPKVKPTKDPKIEEEAILRVMQLAIYGAVMHAGEKENQFEATERVMELFKEANLIK